jgi:hypothetical protein
VGVAALDIDADGAITIDSSAAGVSVDGAAASNFTTSSGALTLDGAGGVNVAGNAAEIDITTSAAVDINSGAGTWDASTLSLDSTDTTNLTMTASDGGDKTLTIASVNAGLGDGLIDIDASGAITIDSSAGGISIDAAAASNFTTSGGALTLDGATGVNIAGNSSEIDITTTGAVDVNSGTATWNGSTMAMTFTGACDIDSAGALSLNSSAAAINIGNDAVAQAINVGTGAAARTITVGNAASTEVELDAILVDINAGTGGVDVDTGALASGAVASGAIALTTGAMSGTATADSGAITLTTGNSIEDTGDITIATGDTTVATKSSGDISLRLGRKSSAGSSFLRLQVTTSAAAVVDAIQIYRDDVTGENIISLKDSDDTIFRMPNTTSAAPGEGAVRINTGGANDVLEYWDTTAAAWVEAGEGVTSLQEAYVGGNTITTSSGEGNLDFTIGASSDFSVILGTTSNTFFQVEQGTDQFKLSDAGANTINADIDVNAFVLDAVTTSLDSTDTTNLTMTANNAGDKTMTVKATNAGAGDGILSLEADGWVAMVDASAAPAPTGYYKGDWYMQAYVAGEAIDAGDILYLTNTAGTVEVKKSIANSSASAEFLGIAYADAADTAAVYVIRHGSDIPVDASEVWTGADGGSPAYIDPDTAGNVTKTAPTTTADWIARIGFITTVGKITVAPQPAVEIL